MRRWVRCMWSDPLDQQVLILGGLLAVVVAAYLVLIFAGLMDWRVYLITAVATFVAGLAVSK